MSSSISGVSGGFSAASLKQMQEQMFKAVDNNGDNKIDKSEMSAFQKAQQADGKQGGPTVDEMFTNMDSDSDGAISRLESDAALAKMSQQMQSQGPPPPPPPEENSSSSSDSSSSNAIFDALDTNKDGTVSASELLAALSSKDSSSSDNSSSDSSSSSSSSSADSSAVKKIFDAMDTNQDGSVSKSELEAALTKKGQHNHSQNTTDSTSTTSTTDTAKTSDAALFAAAAKSYMQASFSSFSQNAGASALSASSLYA